MKTQNFTTDAKLLNTGRLRRSVSPDRVIDGVTGTVTTEVNIGPKPTEKVINGSLVKLF
jgi:hypothetical protein